MPSLDERIIQHTVELAVHSQQIQALMEAHKDVVASMNKLMWTMLGASVSVTVALLGSIAAIALS